MNRALSQNSSSRRLSTTTVGSFMEREIGYALPAGGGSFMNYYAANDYNFDKDEALQTAFLQIFRAHNKQVTRDLTGRPMSSPGALSMGSGLIGLSD